MFSTRMLAAVCANHAEIFYIKQHISCLFSLGKLEFRLIIDSF